MGTGPYGAYASRHADSLFLAQEKSWLPEQDSNLRPID